MFVNTFGVKLFCYQAGAKALVKQYFEGFDPGSE